LLLFSEKVLVETERRAFDLPARPHLEYLERRNHGARRYEDQLAQYPSEFGESIVTWRGHIAFALDSALFHSLHEFALDLTDCFFKSKPFARDFALVQRRLYASQLRNQSRTCALIQRPATLPRGAWIQTRYGSHDQGVIVRQWSLPNAFVLPTTIRCPRDAVQPIASGIRRGKTAQTPHPRHPVGPVRPIAPSLDNLRRVSGRALMPPLARNPARRSTARRPGRRQNGRRKPASRPIA